MRILCDSIQHVAFRFGVAVIKDFPRAAVNHRKKGTFPGRTLNNSGDNLLIAINCVPGKGRDGKPEGGPG